MKQVSSAQTSVFVEPSPQEVMRRRLDVANQDAGSRNQDANRPNSVFLEWEPSRRIHGNEIEPTRVLTLLLASSECSLQCSMCDLWRNTLSQPTPPGAIPRQIEYGLDHCREQNDFAAVKTIKLYNSGNFFDPNTTPAGDDARLIQLCEPFDRVVVENHPSIGTRRLFEFGKRLRGKLEVAVGLECIAPRMLKRLNKRLHPLQFFQFAKRLRDADIDLRVFLIHGLPWLMPMEAIHWTVLSARFAAAAGARHISVLPCRAGNGFMDHLQREGVFTPPTHQQMQDVFARLQSDPRFDNGPVLTLDTWGLDPDEVV
ncbi:Fe-S oxidoreductase [Rhodopirellula halodulae]|uniref:Fe-S oxidoreductase n=1 Tax=Rhodopirellula halodulae TaxID=2894198 RepID=UPI001E381484|nr:Fe-S oxidoreductase [Rhodopirellula sp. JC737]MCC9656616.1 Fe-S oxidoreductase [Rhodopirellula sp. JC737]